MRRIFRDTVVALVAVGCIAGCSKKTMQDTPPPSAPPPTRTVTPAPPAPPPPPAPPKAPERVELNDVFFDYDASGLRDDARATLTENGKKLVSASQATATIEGHCDERGTTDYNLALGEKRASAAKDFLVSYGVDASRLTTISYGENRPFSMGHDEAAFSQNRRAHFVVENR